MTTTPPTHEGDLMELVRGADPLAGDVDPATDAAAESILQPIGVGFPCVAASAPDGSMSRLRQRSPWEGAAGDVRRHCKEP